MNDVFTRIGEFQEVDEYEEEEEEEVRWSELMIMIIQGGVSRLGPKFG